MLGAVICLSAAADFCQCVLCRNLGDRIGARGFWPAYKVTMFWICSQNSYKIMRFCIAFIFVNWKQVERAASSASRKQKGDFSYMIQDYFVASFFAKTFFHHFIYICRKRFCFLHFHVQSEAQFHHIENCNVIESFWLELGNCIK